MGFPLRDEGVVIGIICDQQHLWRTQTVRDKVRQMDTQLQAKDNDRHVLFRVCFVCWQNTTERRGTTAILTQEFRLLVGQNLVENVIISLSLELEGHTRLLQKV